VLTKLLMRILFFVFMQPNVVLSLCVVIFFFKKAVTFLFLRLESVLTVAVHRQQYKIVILIKFLSESCCC